jgi:hypothetical protein
MHDAMKLFHGKRLADGLAAVHAVWGVGAAASFPAVIVWPNIQAYVFWPFVVMVSSWVVLKECPLTSAERWLRSKWDPERRFGGEGFVAHYFGKLTGVHIPHEVARRISYAYATAVILLIVVI